MRREEVAAEPWPGPAANEEWRNNNAVLAEPEDAELLVVAPAVDDAR